MVYGVKVKTGNIRKSYYPELRAYKSSVHISSHVQSLAAQ